MHFQPRICSSPNFTESYNSAIKKEFKLDLEKLKKNT